MALPHGLFLGIDPGANGGLAMIDETGELLRLAAMPVRVERAGTKRRTEIDVAKILELLQAFENLVAGPVETIFYAWELLHPMPAAKGGSLANYARGVARGWEWLLAGMKRWNVGVPPQRWQADVIGKGPAGTTKRRALAFAERTWGGARFVPSRCRVPHGGLVDAACIAWWARAHHAAIMRGEA